MCYVGSCIISAWISFGVNVQIGGSPACLMLVRAFPVFGFLVPLMFRVCFFWLVLRWFVYFQSLDFFHWLVLCWLVYYQSSESGFFRC